MRFTQWSEFGIQFSVYLTKQSQLGNPIIGAAQISESQGIEYQYTQQILQRLRRGGIIESVRGPSGGYRLKRTPEEISLYDIILATEGDTFEIESQGNPVCGELYGMHFVWMNFKAQIDSYLKERSLADIAKLSVYLENTPLQTRLGVLLGHPN